MPSRRLGIAVTALFAVTGFTGLVYEVLWNRILTLTFGNTVVATSTVLAAYMAGLALGAFLVGRIADRVRNPLFLYAALECLVGLFALLLPSALAFALPLLRALYRSHHLTLLGFTRFFVAFFFLLLPTSAMGGTLPALGRLLARVENAGKTLALLYAINTIGAVAGTLASGFWVIPSLGLRATMWSMVLINLAVALSATLLAWRISRHSSANRDNVREVSQLRAREAAGQPAALPIALSRATYRLVLWAFFASGGIALALEVLWARSLLLIFGSTVYAFTSMLAVFLFGLFLGSVLLGLVIDRIDHPVLVLGLVEAAAGFLTLLSVSWVNLLPSLFIDGFLLLGVQWRSWLALKFLISAIVLLPVSIFFGAAFPLVTRMQVTKQERLGSQVGVLYSFNTMGAITGALLAGFVLLPALGLQRSLMAAALCAIVVGALLTLTIEAGGSFRTRLLLSLSLAATGLLTAWTTPTWNRTLLSAGVYFLPRAYISADGTQNILKEAIGDLRVLTYLEGTTETAAVIQTPRNRLFVVDGKVEATTGPVDMRLQRLQGHLPMLFAPRMDRALNIGLGCGITLGSLKVYPLKELKCVELEKNILGAARFFAAQNRDVLDDPRLKIILNDGRNHILLTDEKYDVITSDPFEPLIAGAASLYTEDHFTNGKTRLTPGGIFCQFLPLYQLSLDDYRMIVRSFCHSFPHVTLWYTGTDTVLMGSETPHKTTLDELERRMALPGVKESLEEIGISNAVQLLQTFVMDPSILPEVKNGPINSDNHPHIEFSAPKSHLGLSKGLNLRWLIDHYRPEDMPLDLSTREALATASRARAIGLLAMQGASARFLGRPEESLAIFRKARSLDPTNRTVLCEIALSANDLAALFMQNGKTGDAQAVLDEALSTEEDRLDTFENLALLAHMTGRPQMALDYLLEIHRASPGIPDINVKIASCLQDLGRPEEATWWCDKALVLNPELFEGRRMKARLNSVTGKHQQAAVLFEDLASSHADDLSATDWFYYGVSLSILQRWKEARIAFTRCTHLDPHDPRAWYNAARSAAAAGDARSAREALSKAKSLAPSEVEAWLKGDPALKNLPR